MDKYLFLFTISPVQSYISQARKTQDLKAGSMILSDLISYAIDETTKGDQKAEIIFPSTNIVSKPNRFLAELEFKSNQQAQEFGEVLADTTRKKFISMAEEVFKEKFPNRKYPKLFQTQIDNFLEIYWVIHPLSENYGVSYSEIERLLAAVKNIKVFQQTAEQGRKCSLCGERNGLFYELTKKEKEPYDLEKDSIRSPELDNSETLCAVCFTKRYYRKIAGEFPSTIDIALMEKYDKIIEELRKEGKHNVHLLQYIKDN